MEGFVDPAFASAFASNDTMSNSLPPPVPKQPVPQQSVAPTTAAPVPTTDFFASSQFNDAFNFNELPPNPGSNPTMNGPATTTTTQPPMNTSFFDSNAATIGGFKTTRNSDPFTAPPAISFNSASSANAAANPSSERARLDSDPACLASGNIYSRTSLRTIITKAWKTTTFWVHLSPATLLLFRSPSDYSDYLSNPYHSAKERNYLIKLKVDFLTELSEKGVRGFNVTEIKSKSYGNTPTLHQFKLEKIMDYGPNILAAFAAPDVAAITALRNALVSGILAGRGTPPGGGCVGLRQSNAGQGVVQKAAGEKGRESGGGKGGYDFGAI